jgi:NADH dehydrogenase (ubiquinone) Fe-S protein 6
MQWQKSKSNTVYFFQILHETTASIRINGSNSIFDYPRNSRRRIACAGYWSGSQIRWNAWLHRGGVHNLTTENNFLRKKKIAVSIQARNVLTCPRYRCVSGQRWWALIVARESQNQMRKWILTVCRINRNSKPDYCNIHNMLSRCSLPCLNSALRSLPRFASSSTMPSTTDAKINKSEVTVHQAPNYPTTWSTSQRPRPGLHSGPRFEQTDMSLQPNPLSAMELIAQEPIRLVQGRKAVCDGGESQVFLYCPTRLRLLFRRWTTWSPKNLHQLGMLTLQAVSAISFEY